jgi:hypothetical protein
MDNLFKMLPIKGMDEYDLSPLTAKLVERKSLLAKLLANENIRIQQEQRDQPRFEFATRTLYLPMWNTASETVYNLLVGHETGHAVDTPEREWNESIESLAKKYSITPVPSKKMKDIAHGYINTIEDIRIEKKRIKKFPGLKKDFLEGYKELEERGFFNGALKSSSKLYFIDRINLKYKLNKLYPYSKIELALLDEIDKMDSFQDAVTVADKILAYESSKIDQTDPPDMGLKIFVVCEDPDEGDGQQQGEGNGKFSKTSKEPSDESKGSEGRDSGSDRSVRSKGNDSGGEQEPSKQGNEQSGSGDSGEKPGSNDKTKSEGGGSVGDRSSDGQDSANSRASNEGNNEDQTKGDQPGGKDQNSGEGTDDPQQQIGYATSNGPESGVNGAAKSLVYKPVRDITIHLDAPIVYNLFEKAKHQMVDKAAVGNVYITVGKPKIKDIIKRHSKNSFKGITTTAFLKFKNAERKTTSFLVSEFEMKKAAIDFSRQKISKTGILNTNKMFAYKYSDDIFKKNIVVEKGKNHGFIMIIDGSSSMSGYMEKTLKQMLSVVLFCRQIGVPFEVYIFKGGGSSNGFQKGGVNQIEFGAFELELLLDSRMSKLEFINAASYVCTRITAFGGTPLIQSIAASPYLVASFQSKYRVDIMNVIFLTDGESDACSVSIGTGKHGAYNVYLKDTILNKDLYVNRFDSNSYGNISFSYNSGLQEVLLGRLKEWTQCNLIGFFLAESIKINYYPDVNKNDWNNYGFTSTKKAGYDEYFLIDSNKLDLSSNITSLAGLASIKNTRKMLSTFVERIAK